MKKSPEARQPLTKRSKAAIAAIGLAAASLVGVQLARSSASHNSEAPVFGKGISGPELLAQENLISHNIGAGKPVTFRKGLAYYNGPGKEHFYIENPLQTTIDDHGKKAELIGYIEPKGGPTGPDVVLFQLDSSTTSLMSDPADLNNMPQVNEVVFPSPDGASFDINNPVNPATRAPYVDQAHEPLLVGYQYASKK